MATIGGNWFENESKKLPTFLKRLLIGAVSLFSIWVFCFHYTNVSQVAITRNVFTGVANIDSVSGFNFTTPWVQVARLDTRPHRVCIECDCRWMKCELVTFDPSGWSELVEREGFRYYWWSNRFSFNSGHKQTYRGLIDVLRGYSFDDGHSFLKTLRPKSQGLRNLSTKR